MVFVYYTSSNANCRLDVNHLPGTCSCGKYSLRHRLQNVCVRPYTNYHRRTCSIYSGLISGSVGNISRSQIRIYASVRAFGFPGSLPNGVMGRKLTHASIWHNKVCRSSSVGRVSLITRKILNFMLFTALSYSPPKWDVNGGLKCHLFFLRAIASLLC